MTYFYHDHHTEIVVPITSNHEKEGFHANPKEIPKSPRDWTPRSFFTMLPLQCALDNLRKIVLTLEIQ